LYAHVDEVVRQRSLLARNCRAGGTDQCPKLGVERTQRGHAAMADSDPQESLAQPKSRSAAPRARPKNAILLVPSTGHWLVKRRDFIALLGPPVGHGRSLMDSRRR